MLKISMYCLSIASGICFCAYYLFPLFFFAKEEKIIPFSKENIAIQVENKSLDYSFLLTKKQKGLRYSFPFPSLKDSIYFLGTNTRPDNFSPKSYLLATSDSEKIFLPESKKAYLQFLEGKLHFSNEKTPLYIEAISIENDALDLQISIQLEDSSGEIFLQEKETVTLKNIQIEKGIFPNEEAIFSLENAKFWGKDQLLQKYGGEEYAKFLDKERLEVNNQEIIFVSSGDLLYYTDSNWKKAEALPDYENKPIAKVTVLSNGTLGLRVWDESGFFSKKIQVMPEVFTDKLAVAKELFSSFHKRTSTRVSCKVGKKTLFLKQGDWILRTPRGWRILKEVQEIDDLLSYKIRSELLIFDGIEKNGEGQFFKGTLFNTMRTKVDKLAIAIHSAKNNSYKASYLTEDEDNEFDDLFDD